MWNKYNDLELKNVCDQDIDLDSEEEKEELKKKNDDCKEMFELMKEAIPEVKEIRFTNKLNNHPVCLSTVGPVSVEM